MTNHSTTSLTGINLTNSNIGVSNILLPQTSTQNQAGQQLIGGAISPSLFVTTALTSSNIGHHQVILNNIPTQMPVQPVSLLYVNMNQFDMYNCFVTAMRTRFVAVASINILFCRSYIHPSIHHMSCHFYIRQKAFFGSSCVKKIFIFVGFLHSV